MEGEALARPESEALIPHPLLIGARHAGHDGLVAAGLQLAITGSAVGRPEGDDHPLARVRIRLVPYRAVAIDECRKLAHSVSPLLTTFPNSVPCMKYRNASHASSKAKTRSMTGRNRAAAIARFMASKLARLPTKTRRIVVRLAAQAPPEILIAAFVGLRVMRRMI